MFRHKRPSDVKARFRSEVNRTHPRLAKVFNFCSNFIGMNYLLMEEIDILPVSVSVRAMSNFAAIRLPRTLILPNVKFCNTRSI